MPRTQDFSPAQNLPPDPRVLQPPPTSGAIPGNQAFTRSTPGSANESGSPNDSANSHQGAVGNSDPFAATNPGANPNAGNPATEVQQSPPQNSGQAQPSAPANWPNPAAGPATSPAAPARRMVGASPMPAVPMAPPRQIHTNGANQLDGAGIVQRAATPIQGGPQHVLLAPNGRILAYLYPDRGVNLDAFLGRSMGIFGVRSFRPELQTDMIVVRSMVPVRLAP